jgi:Surface-adhesin protein E
MNTRNIIFALVLLCLFARSTHASNWELLAENNDQQFYIDKESIEHSEITCLWCIRCCLNTADYCMCNLPEDLMRVWTKKIFKHPGKYQAIEELDFQEYACEKGMSRLLHATRIYPDGTGDSVNLNLVLKWEDITSDTLRALLHKYLCKKNI